MYKRIALSLTLGILLLCLSVADVSATFKVNAYLFYGEGCPHCAKEREFFAQIDAQYENVDLYEFEIYYNPANNDFFKKTITALHSEISGVPFLVIGDRYFIGWADSISPEEITGRIAECSTIKCPDTIAAIVGARLDDTSISASNKIESEPVESSAPVRNDGKMMRFPFLGEINAMDFSLPMLAVIMGGLDGFNPCAMWTLLFLISLLLGMQNRRRMWILGSVFIITSASVYFVFMAAWLNLILFIGLVTWVRTAIGLGAVIGGGFSLNKYFSGSGDGCRVVGTGRRQRVFAWLRSITSQKGFFLALGGIVLLAFAVNLVELICSAGLPVAFTQVLALSDLAKWQYYLYIAIYILVFMLDDLFVFFAAMITLQMMGITTKYSRFSHLIGGILMLVIGLLLMFKPEWLMFG